MQSFLLGLSKSYIFPFLLFWLWLQL